MRLIPVAIGVLILLTGVVWILQGAGYLLGSFMSNDRTWLWIGVVTAVLGFGVLIWGVRPRTAAKHI